MHLHREWRKLISWASIDRCFLFLLKRVHFIRFWPITFSHKMAIDLIYKFQWFPTSEPAPEMLLDERRAIGAEQTVSRTTTVFKLIVFWFFGFSTNKLNINHAPRPQNFNQLAIVSQSIGIVKTKSLSCHIVWLPRPYLNQYGDAMTRIGLNLSARNWTNASIVCKSPFMPNCGSIAVICVPKMLQFLSIAAA